MFNPNSITSMNKIINYAYVSPDKIEIWESRGFKENKDFSLNLWDDSAEYFVMTRELISLINYGKERLIGTEIIDLCPFIGSYGMGGPGYFGFKVKVKNDIMCLLYVCGMQMVI